MEIIYEIGLQIDECGLDCSYPNKENVSKGNTYTLDQLKVNKIVE